LRTSSLPYRLYESRFLSLRLPSSSSSLLWPIMACAIVAVLDFLSPLPCPRLLLPPPLLPPPPLLLIAEGGEWDGGPDPRKL